MVVIFAARASPPILALVFEEFCSRILRGSRLQNFLASLESRQSIARLLAGKTEPRKLFMELKVVCACGQKFKFEVEPVGGRMPFAVNCPVCHADGTAAANALLAEKFMFVPPMPGSAARTPSAPPPPLAGLRINREVHAAPATVPTAVTENSPPPIRALSPPSTEKKSRSADAGVFSLGRGILGAVIGAAVGCGLLFACWLWLHFRFPLMGIAVGAAAGYAARWLARGTDTKLGIITSVIAGLSVTGTFVLMYGGFAAFNIVSIVICAGVAYRAASE